MSNQAPSVANFVAGTADLFAKYLAESGVPLSIEQRAVLADLSEPVCACHLDLGCQLHDKQSVGGGHRG